MKNFTTVESFIFTDIQVYVFPCTIFLLGTWIYGLQDNMPMSITLNMYSLTL